MKLNPALIVMLFAILGVWAFMSSAPPPAYNPAPSMTNGQVCSVIDSMWLAELKRKADSLYLSKTYQDSISNRYTKSQTDALISALSTVYKPYNYTPNVAGVTGLQDSLNNRYTTSQIATLLSSYATTASVAGLARAAISQGTGINYNSGTGVIAATNTGTVTSIGVTSTDLTVSGSPVTASGSVTLNINNTSKTNWNAAYANMGKVILRNKAGVISSTAQFVTDTFTIAGTGLINLSSYLSANGFTGMLPIGVCGYRNGATANNSPQLSLSAWTSTSVTVLPTQQNTAVVAILGINVLSGTPLIPVTDLVNVKCYLSFLAY